MVGARVVHELASRIRTLTFLRTKVPLPARAVEPIQFEQQETENRDWEDDVAPVWPAEEQRLQKTEFCCIRSLLLNRIAPVTSDSGAHARISGVLDVALDDTR